MEIRMSKVQKIRQGTIKRYKVQGVTYTYHRPSGVRLPDLPFSDPRFLAAHSAAEDQMRIQSKNGAQRRGALSEIDVPVKKMRPSTVPDAIAYTVPQCAHFVLQAKPKEVVLYHSGDLARDGASDALIRDKQQYLLLAAGFGLVSLRVARVQAGWSHYLAVRSEESLVGLPRRVLQCDISPSEYIALVAIDERQGAQATTRAIRDALGIRDAEAATLRNTLIEQGWLASTRPPELTALGRSLLA